MCNSLRRDGRSLDNGVHWLDKREELIKQKRIEGLRKYHERKRLEKIEAIKKEVELQNSRNHPHP